ncbi:unnamed protein product [Caenorhabditis brenneri]
MVYKQPGPNLRQRSAGRLPTMRINSWCPSTSTSDLVCACGSTRSFFNIQDRWSSSTSGTYHWVQSNDLPRTSPGMRCLMMSPSWPRQRSSVIRMSCTTPSLTVNWNMRPLSVIIGRSEMPVNVQWVNLCASTNCVSEGGSSTCTL